jgi:hypothetical protein
MDENKLIDAYAHVTPGQDVRIYYGEKLLVIDNTIVTREPKEPPKWLSQAKKVAIPEASLEEIYSNMNRGFVPTREVRGLVLRVLAAMEVSPETLDERVMPTGVLPVASRVRPGDYKD